MSEKKYRLNIDFKTEKDKQFLYAVANICGLRKQPTNVDLYIHSLIDYRDVIEALYTPPSEPELEIDLNEVDKDLTETLNSFLQTFENLASFLSSVFSKIREKIRKIRSGKHGKT
jgi:hypothetical protein